MQHLPPHVQAEVVALWRRHREAPPTPEQARALVAEFNKRQRARRKKQAQESRALSRALDRQDWARAGELWGARERPGIEAIRTQAEHAHRIRLSRAGNTAKQQRAEKRAARYVNKAKSMLRRRPEMPISTIIAFLRESKWIGKPPKLKRPKAPPSVSQLRRWLKKAGLK